MEIHDPDAAGDDLPRAVVIIGVFTEPDNRPSNVAYYGFPVQESLSTVIHPNELTDGAITPSTIRTVSYHPITWNWQHQPLVLGLLRDKRYRFAGVILERIGFETSREKEIAAHNAVRVAMSLGADAALITRTGSGNAFIEVMLTVKGCEEKGIKTVLVTYEYGGKDGADAPLLYYEKEADAVISTGNRDIVVELPAADRVVGAYDQPPAHQLSRRPLRGRRRPLDHGSPRRHRRRHRHLGRPRPALPAVLKGYLRSGFGAAWHVEHQVAVLTHIIGNSTA